MIHGKNEKVLTEVGIREKQGPIEAPAGEPIGVAARGLLGHLERLSGQPHWRLRHETSSVLLVHNEISPPMRYSNIKMFFKEANSRL